MPKLTTLTQKSLAQSRLDGFTIVEESLNHDDIVSGDFLVELTSDDLIVELPITNYSYDDSLTDKDNALAAVIDLLEKHPQGSGSEINAALNA